MRYPLVFRMVFALVMGGAASLRAAEEMPDLWSKDISHGQATAQARPDTTWFRDAKFGIFMHWGLYSEAGNVWKGKDYYGSGEWLMHQAKIPAGEYAKLADTFNPTHFNADEWASFVHDTGAKYLVITAKHHEGFAMFKSAASPFNIVDATPYKQDPMAGLSAACRKEGVQFGFYYSQNLDWHEPNGGGNTWDFDKTKKDIKKYYAEKSIPQIKELLTNYGRLGIMWFDMPGGLTKEETAAFMENVRRVQPQCLVSSRIGQGLGDFSDLGDSELPATPVEGPWEALFTHTDSWGFQKYDENFKSAAEVIRLLASVAARGGNLLLNVGPDGEGNLPEKSVRYLREVGAWLGKNGESIYGTTASPIPDQPWGVMTAKPGVLYLHVLHVPRNGEIVVPEFSAQATSVAMLDGASGLGFKGDAGTLAVELSKDLPDAPDHVVKVAYTGELKDGWAGATTYVTKQHDTTVAEVSGAVLSGKAKVTRKTFSKYFGNWKHETVIEGLEGPGDAATFNVRLLEPGDYKMILEYACTTPESKGREGVIEVEGGKSYRFETLFTGPFDSHQPLMIVQHEVGIVTAGQKAPEMKISVHPLAEGAPMFWLRRVLFEPVR